MIKEKKVAFQGSLGAYSDLACRTVFPNMQTVACPLFEDVFAAVHEGKADLAMLPVENSIAGRVADIHHLLPDGGLFIVGEHFQPVNHCLLGIAGAEIKDIKAAHSHGQALAQCRKNLREMGILPVVHSNTAGAAEAISLKKDKTQGAIASSLAAEIYGLSILRETLQDDNNNTTRFLIMSKEKLQNPPQRMPMITSFLFQVRSIPAALYKALGGFATNGVNLTKLESYMSDSFPGDDDSISAQFFCDIEGKPEDLSVKLAFEELSFFVKRLDILGVYPAHPFRYQKERK
ncbi:MAG: prephenate dehydratase [Alphaproteobacteria bacterium]